MNDDDWWEFAYLEPILDELVRLSKEEHAVKHPNFENGEEKIRGNRR